MKTDDKKPAPKKAVPGKVFDVSRPGKTAASPTSRPVIMGHKPEAQAAQTAVSGIGEASPLLTKRKIQVLPSGDSAEEAAQVPVNAATEPEDVPAGAPAPTPADAEEDAALGAAAVDAVSGPPALPPEKTAEPEPEAEAPPTDKPKLVITPPSEPEAKPAETETTPEPETPEPEPADQPAAEPETTQPPAEESRPETTPVTEDIPTSTASSVSETETQVAATAADPLKPAEEPPYPKIDPLFDESGHIVVSHHNHHRTHSLKVVALLLVILVLAAVAVNILLDLEIVNLQGLPHTDFFPS
jgi:hypothetical protein